MEMAMWGFVVAIRFPFHDEVESLHLVRKRDDGKCTDRSVALVVGRDAHVSTFSIYACAGKYSH